jgi:Virulence factor
MAASLTVIWWRDIPAQVIAREGRRTHKVVLHPRFQVAIDKAAMNAGKRSANDYIEEWRRESQPCADDLEAAGTAEARRLDSTYTREVLARLIDSGGVDEQRRAQGTTADQRPTADQRVADATGEQRTTDAG